MSEELHSSVKHLLENDTAEDDRVQEIRQASFTRANLTEAERLVGQGALWEETARGNLESARGKNAVARELAENQLADALAMQGKYAEAATTHHDKHARKQYRDIAAAIDKPDGEICKCKPKKHELNGVEIAVPTTHIARMVFSRKHGDVVGLEVCACGKMNARPLTGVHAMAASTLNKPDVQVLKANG